MKIAVVCLLFLLYVKVEGVRMTISQYTVPLNYTPTSGDGQSTKTSFTCDGFTETNVKFIQNIKIHRLTSSDLPGFAGIGPVAAYIDAITQTAEIILIDLQSRATVSGNIDTLDWTQSELVVTIMTEHLHCEDEGMYTCEINYETNDAVGLSPRDSANLTIHDCTNTSDSVSTTDLPVHMSLSTTQVSMKGYDCFACKDMSHLEYCDVIQRCKDHEICYVEMHKGEAGVSYNSGCRDADVCWKRQQLSDNQVCVECCHHDFCNNKGCGETGAPSRDMRGPICLDCHHVGSPEECHSISLCDMNQVCSIEKFKWGDHFHYKLGCAHQLCQPLFRSVHHIATRSTPACHACCQTDFCNRNCTASNTGLPPEMIG